MFCELAGNTGEKDAGNASKCDEHTLIKGNLATAADNSLH